MIILHRDIKPHNMLLFNECTILKIADFGGSRFGKDGLSQPPPFTQGFASPELISTDDYDETVDIYAFGMTLKCLLMKSCNLYSTGDVRWYSPFLTNLIARCTSTDINDRPSADQLMRIFDIAFEKIYADDIKKLKLETPYCEIENVVEPKLNTPCYINESTNAPAYQKYVEHAANYVKEKKEIANVQKEIDDLLNEIIERSRVPESDQARAKQMMLLYAEMGKDSFSKYKHNKSTLKAQPPHQVQPHIPPVGTVSLNADENDFALLPLYASEASFSSHNVSLEDQLASYGLPPAFGRQNNRQGRQASQEPER
ncbi:unnamed protein product [Hymenolepis diminuta]|uniref:non-specific serine/threonine protein kinase n=1 Tax=Hymenolepis diminuta TaxID=6216 RepID=A0A0R3SS95_HYMDI|nr:unnamed protein product [Hymenolepis diminuta]